MTPIARSEKDEERDADAMVRAFLGSVRRYSEPRAAKIHRGTSDREYVVLGTIIRWELKAEDGKLTAEQYQLLCEDYMSGRVVGCGTAEDLNIVLVAVRHDLYWGRTVGFRLLTLWAARGLRKGKQRTV